jgi:putative transcriptional regulator
MNDDIFGRSVIYICEHNLEGAMGLIINKPMDDISFKDLKNVNHINSDRFQSLRMKLYFGGPILVEKIIALHTNELKIKTAIPLNNKISISSGKEIIRDIENDINLNYKLFCGHSRWSPGQLEREIENGDWLLQASKTDLLFNLTAEKIWGNAAESLGINIIDISNMSGSA